MERELRARNTEIIKGFGSKSAKECIVHEIFQIRNHDKVADWSSGAVIQPSQIGRDVKLHHHLYVRPDVYFPYHPNTVHCRIFGQPRLRGCVRSTRHLGICALLVLVLVICVCKRPRLFRVMICFTVAWDSTRVLVHRKLMQVHRLGSDQCPYTCIDQITVCTSRKRCGTPIKYAMN